MIPPDPPEEEKQDLPEITGSMEVTDEGDDFAPPQPSEPERKDDI